MFFTGDHEPPYNIYEAGDHEFAEYQQFVDEKADAILRAMQGVDVLIADSSYTSQEYPAKRGWGHGSFDSSIAYARQARRQALFLHPPRTHAQRRCAGSRFRAGPVGQPGAGRRSRYPAGARGRHLRVLTAMPAIGSHRSVITPARTTGRCTTRPARACSSRPRWPASPEHALMQRAGLASAQAGTGAGAACPHDLDRRRPRQQRWRRNGGGPAPARAGASRWW